MATIILGGGIIGLSTAYELSLIRRPSQTGNPLISIVDSSHSLLLSASGLAGGFVAEDWFSPASSSLGALSFKLHRELAEKHNGQSRWGYAGSHVYSLSISGTGVSKPLSNPSKEDWLSSGTSRAGIAPGSSSPEPLNADGSPTCFTPQPGGTLSTIGTIDDCAQVHPHSLCSFLLSECQSRGVQVHLSATPTAITTDSSTSTITGLTYTSPATNEPTTIPCTNLVLAAGAWTPSLFRTLFPLSRARIPIYPLAGYSLLAHSPRYTTPFLAAGTGKPSSGSNNSSSSSKEMCYAIYTSPTPPSFSGAGWSYAPEAFARLAPDGGHPEIWIGGLNEPALALPERAEQVAPLLAPEAVADLRGVFVQLCGKLDGRGGVNEDDLRTVREGLCFRPVSETGVPVIGRVPEELLGGVKTAGPGDGGVFVASGHGPWGISLSLGTGRVVSELVLGKDTSADISRLGLR